MYGNHPEFLARKDDGPMDSDEFHSVVRSAIVDALQFTDEQLSTERVTATEYYHGRPFGGETAGRSQVVLPEVRDAIIGVLPSLLRIIHGPEHVVEIVPRRADSTEMAQQATDYLRYVYEEDNEGLLTTLSTLKDGLLKRLGIIKWGMEEAPVVRQMQYVGITHEDLIALVTDDAVTLTKHAVRPDGLIDVELSVKAIEARLWVRPIPPDDFYFNREARSKDDALLMGHRSRLTKGELRALGVSERDIEDNGGTSPTNTLEEQARRLIVGTSGWLFDAPSTPENERVLYCESYMRIDRDGDGIAELRRICTIGDAHYPVKDVPADEQPFGLFCPDPEPHTILGGSWYDRLKDVQKINSQLLRTVLDSASIAAFPRMAVVEGQVNMRDVLDTAIGAPLRMRAPGMAQPFDQPFTGEKLLPMFGIMREVVERRVGQKDGAGSLNMDALQSTGQQAANAAIQAASAQPELLARLFCEQVLKPMFRGLARLANHPASKARIVRLRGNYVSVDPRTWDTDMDVSVNVALGAMDTERKVMMLEKVIADQQAIMQQLGPDNPIVTLPMVRNAKAKVLALQGIKDVDNYYKPLPPDWQPPPPPPPQPSPEELWIQAEKEMAQQKAMKELAIKEDELRLKEAQSHADNDFRDRELALKERDAEMRLMEGPHNAEIERYKADADTAIRQQELAAEMSVEDQKAQLEREKMALELRIAELGAQTQVEVVKATPPPTPPPPKEPKDTSSADGMKAMAMAIEALGKQAPQQIVVNAPPVTVHNEAPKRGKRTGKVTAPDGAEYTMESEEDDDAEG